ncbi:molybdate ABC transporter substrate-binding protein [Cryptobacterium curtum]
MKNKGKWLVSVASCLAFVCALALAGCSSGTTASTDNASNVDSSAKETTQLQIFAANSLSKAMDEVQQLYTRDHSGITFADTQYKSSGELNELLAGGASADVLISASKAKMDDAESAGYVDVSTRFNMFKNDLVMVTSEKNDAITEVSLDDIAAGKYKVAVGDESVPAGNYACQSLSTVGCYTEPDGTTGKDATGKGGQFSGALAADGMVSLQTSVGNVCKQAQSGDVDIAFVYTSDVYRFGGVKVVGTVPANTHKNIIYPAAITAQTDHAAEAQAFLDWCTTDPEALAVWQKWGFEMAA